LLRDQNIAFERVQRNQKEAGLGFHEVLIVFQINLDSLVCTVPICELELANKIRVSNSSPMVKKAFTRIDAAGEHANNDCSKREPQSSELPTQQIQTSPGTRATSSVDSLIELYITCRTRTQIRASALSICNRFVCHCDGDHIFPPSWSERMLSPNPMTRPASCTRICVVL
jgi:hypothetical protein